MDLHYPKIKVLMVGVGGIGCEVLKMISKLDFEEFHIIDMDTIEVSNLNRQFLFRKEHRGQSKALIAKETMKKIAPHLNIIAHFAAINTPGYTLKFFRQFDAVIMALDNAETRSYVNKVCKALNIFMVDAGSMGFKGQANSYYPCETECYDCFPVATTQKQYPACTIRSQPTNCVHCVIWAKYLFQQLFSGAPQDAESGILEFDKVDKSNPKDVFLKFFNEEIKDHKIELLDHQLLKKVDPQAKYSLGELQGLWFYAFGALAKEPVEFDKDNRIHAMFIFASTVMRCHNFSIEPYDYQKIKTIAGNIIHAIASTNSIVAALEVMKLLQFMMKKPKTFQELKGPSYVSTGKRERILTVKSARRHNQCSSCFPVQKLVEVDLEQVTVGQLVELIKRDELANKELNLIYQSRLLYDDEDEELCDLMKSKPLKDVLVKELDNRIMVKNIDDQMLFILWVLHENEKLELQMQESRSPNLLQFEAPLIDQKPQRKRVSVSKNIVTPEVGTNLVHDRTQDQSQKKNNSHKEQLEQEIIENLDESLPRKQIKEVSLDSPVKEQAKPERVDIVID